MSSALIGDLQKDVRLIERGLAKGFLSRAAADKLTRDLPDVADKGEFIDAEALDIKADEPAED